MRLDLFAFTGVSSTSASIGDVDSERKIFLPLFELAALVVVEGPLWSMDRCSKRVD